MRRLLPGAVLLALIVLLVLIGAWWFSPGPNAVATDRASDRATATSAPARPRGASASGPDAAPDESARTKRLREGAIAREAMRQRILAAAAAREASAPTKQPGPTLTDAPAARPAKAKQPEVEAPPEPAALNDRTGNHAYITRVFSERLMPLVDECDELARASNPKLAGMLNLNLELVGDEDIGGVIEAIEPDPSNEVTDPTMMECVRESLLAITLPPPDDGGRDGMMLSLRLDPEE